MQDGYLGCLHELALTEGRVHSRTEQLDTGDQLRAASCSIFTSTNHLGEILNYYTFSELEFLSKVLLKVLGLTVIINDVENTWLYSPRYPIEMWSVFHAILLNEPRTNNVSRGGDAFNTAALLLHISLCTYSW